MPKLTFTMELEAEEILHARDAVKDIVQDFGFPVYEITVSTGDSMRGEIGGSERGVINLPPVGGRSLGEDVDSFSKWVEEALPDWALDDEEEDETDPCIVLPGMVLQLDNGLVYQVFSIDATGRVILDQLEELPTNDEGETIH